MLINPSNFPPSLIFAFHLAPSVLSTRLDKHVYFLLGVTVHAVVTLTEFVFYIISHRNMMYRRAMVTSSLITTSFLIGWFPTMAAFLLYDWSDVDKEKTADATRILGTLGLLQSFCNPIIFKLRNRDFRFGLKVGTSWISSQCLSILTITDQNPGIDPKYGSIKINADQH